MTFPLPSLPYPPAREDGYWAPKTSTIDWCEENYYATPYAAELVNTFTNALFVYLSYSGITSCLRNTHDTVFLVAYIGYLLVGSGSFAFHATLKYPMQLVDELSMIYTTCLMFWATFSWGRRRSVQVLLGVFCAALALGITGVYHWLQEPAFHQNCFAGLTVVVLGRSVWVMEGELRPAFRRRSVEEKKKPALLVSEAEQLRRDARDEVILRRMWTLIVIGLSIFLGGFGLWTLDNAFCSTLRSWRREIGLPWGILLEGHGWWHLMTGLGAYYYIVWGSWLRHCINGKQDEYELVWPSFWTSVPRVERVRGNSSRGGAGSAASAVNGDAEKKKLH